MTPFSNAPIVWVDGNQFTTDSTGKVVLLVLRGSHTIAVADVYTLSTDTRVRFAKWADGTSTRAIVLSISSDMTVSAQYTYQYLVSILFRDADGTLPVIPDSIILVALNGSSKTLTSYSSLWLDKGQWTISKITWNGIDVKLDNYGTLLVNAPGEIDVRCAIFDVTVTVQDILGFKIEGAQTLMTLPYGSVQEQTTTQTGTVHYASVPRGKFSISVTNLGITTTQEGDASVNREVIMTIPLSTSTLVVGIVTSGGALGGLAYVLCRRSRMMQPIKHVSQEVIQKPICPKCGLYLERRGNLFWCPNCSSRIALRDAKWA